MLPSSLKLRAGSFKIIAISPCSLKLNRLSPQLPKTPGRASLLMIYLIMVRYKKKALWYIFCGMAYYLSFDRFAYLSNGEYGPNNHEISWQNKKHILLPYENCMSQSQKTNILFHGAMTAKIVISFCHAPDYYSARLDGYHRPIYAKTTRRGYLSYSPEKIVRYLFAWLNKIT